MLEKVTCAIMYCQENRELLHKYYPKIAKETMHPDNYHLIEHHKALLPSFENEKDDESKLMLEWMWTKRSKELSCYLGIICCSYLVKPLHQPKFCLHLEIPTKIPSSKYQYMVNQY
jgi:hypothetical protein